MLSFSFGFVFFDFWSSQQLAVGLEVAQHAFVNEAYFCNLDYVADVGRG